MAFFEDAGAPVHTAEFSGEDLDALWAFAVATVVGSPADPTPLTTANTSYWVPFKLPRAEYLGVDGCKVVDHLAAWVEQYILLRSPNSTWVIGKVKNQEGFRETLFHIDNGPDMAMQNWLSSLLSSAKEGASDRDLSRRDPDQLRKELEARGIGASATPSSSEPDVPLIELSELEPGQFHVTVADERLLNEQIDLLVERAAQRSDINKVHREDREVLIVESTAVEAELLSVLIELAEALLASG